MSSPTNILSIHDGHNSSSLLQDYNGNTLRFDQEERFTKKKNQYGIPLNSIKSQIEEYGSENISLEICSEIPPYPFISREAIIAYYDKSLKSNLTLNSLSKLNNFKFIKNYRYQSKLRTKESINYIKNSINQIIKIKDCNIYNHHECHAYSAFYSSSFYKRTDLKTIVLTVDGSGDSVCSSLSIQRGGLLQKLWELPDRYSLGRLYAFMTYILGMVPLEHEYKLMGLAPYASTQAANKCLEDLINITNYKSSKSGSPWSISHVAKIERKIKDYIFTKRFDVLAAGIQLLIEKILKDTINSILNFHKPSRLAISGGVFMNVKLNSQISDICSKKSIELYVQPSCGDESLPLGASYMYFIKKGITPNSVPNNLYLGKSCIDEPKQKLYSKLSFLKNNYEIIPYSHEVAANKIAAGYIFGRCVGRTEFGARALGNRSIIADPRSLETINNINNAIKNRDFWMPFACTILEEYASRYIVPDSLKNIYTAKFMMNTFNTTIHARKTITAGIHPKDKTTRCQILSSKENKDYYDLILSFGQMTDTYSLLNTSLNLHGYPVVNDLDDALYVLDNSGLDGLILTKYIVIKSESVIN